MTDDIAMRLRGLSLFWGMPSLAEAADEIERLTRERDEARAEVGRMKKLHPPLADLPWPPREEAKP